jgi:hypothetical protein
MALYKKISLLLLGQVLLGMLSFADDCGNLALNKNAIQSSTYTHPDPKIVSSAALSVDGNGGRGDYFSASCSHTLAGFPTWWAVDLGQETRVGRVRITNRGDAGVPGASRLNNFIVGLTNVSPWTAPPNPLASSICHYHSGYLPGFGLPIDLYCGYNTNPGRYLYILLTEPGVIHFCELEAYYN